MNVPAAGIPTAVEATRDDGTDTRRLIAMDVASGPIAPIKGPTPSSPEMTRSAEGASEFQKRFNQGGRDEADGANVPWVLDETTRTFDSCRFPGLAYLCKTTCAPPCCYCFIAPLICGIGVQVHVDDTARTIRLRQWSGYSCCLCCQTTVPYDDVASIAHSQQGTPNTILGTIKPSSAEQCASFCGNRKKEWSVHIMTKGGGKIDLGTAFGSKREAELYGMALHRFFFERGDLPTKGPTHPRPRLITSARTCHPCLRRARPVAALRCPVRGAALG